MIQEHNTGQLILSDVHVVLMFAVNSVYMWRLLFLRIFIHHTNMVDNNKQKHFTAQTNKVEADFKFGYSLGP